MPKEILTPREKSAKLKKITLWFGILSVAGLLDSIWLLILHASRGSMGSVCGFAPQMSCDALFIREYSEWFGIPVPVFSILYFGFLIAVCIQTLWKQDRHTVRPFLYLALPSWIGLGATLYMMYTALIVLKTFCPFCAILWVILVASWTLGLQMMKTLDQVWGYLISEDLRRGYRTVWFWGTVLITGVVLAVSYLSFHAGGRLGGTAFTIAGPEARSLGPANAAVTITVFSDFQCPACKVAAEVLRELTEEMTGRVRLIYKFYPLDSSCNPYLKRPMHRYACAAASAAYCASAQGKFWTYHDYLFTNQTEIPEENLFQFAQSSDLDLKKFDACHHDRHALEEVQKDIAEGNRLGIRGTPTIFVNGQQYSGPVTLSALKETVSGIR
jgi:predicted DsbA family dithiol-disulfide isomerase/uncharacterized membrane protein